MSDSETPVPPLAQALGKVASGLFVVTTTGPDGPLGFVASFVIQAGFEPPTVSVAVAKGRDHLAAIREQGGFAVSIVDKESSGAMGAFFKKREPGESPFDDLATHGAPSGIPVLSDALGWLDCKLAGEHATGDHVVVYGTVEAGSLTREGDPMTHVRKDGRTY